MKKCWKDNRGHLPRKFFIDEEIRVPRAYLKFETKDRFVSYKRPHTDSTL